MQRIVPNRQQLKLKTRRPFGQNCRSTHKMGFSHRQAFCPYEIWRSRRSSCLFCPRSKSVPTCSVLPVTTTLNSNTTQFHLSLHPYQRAMALRQCPALSCFRARVDNAAQAHGFQRFLWCLRLMLLRSQARKIATFTRAAPIIQEPLNSQNYNRYSYALKYPLVYIENSFQSGCAANLFRRAWFSLQTLLNASAETA